MALLEQDLRDAGIDPGRLDRIIGRSMATTSPRSPTSASMWRSSSSRLSRWRSEVAACLVRASERGRTSYTVFVTDRRRLDATEPFVRVARAIYKTSVGLPPIAGRVAAAIADYFPALDPASDRRAGALPGQACGARTRCSPEGGFDRLRRALPRQRLSQARGPVRRMRRQPPGRGGRRG